MFQTSLPITQVWLPTGVKNGAVCLCPGTALAILASSEVVKAAARLFMVDSLTFGPEVNSLQPGCSFS
jgi:hypothetical protein